MRGLPPSALFRRFVGPQSMAYANIIAKHIIGMKKDARNAPEDVRRFASHVKSAIGTSAKNTDSFALMTPAIHGVMTAPPNIAMIMPGPPSLKHFGSSPPSAIP